MDMDGTLRCSRDRRQSTVEGQLLLPLQSTSAAKWCNNNQWKRTARPERPVALDGVNGQRDDDEGRVCWTKLKVTFLAASLLGDTTTAGWRSRTSARWSEPGPLYQEWR